MRPISEPPRSRFETVYSVVVLVKGIDGFLELILGVVLLVAPGAVGDVLLAVAAESAEGTSGLRVLLASGLSSAGHQVGSGVVAVSAFLLVHGVVKLLTVYCLLRRLLRWYPWAIAVLGVLLVIQLSDAVVQPTFGAWLLAGLDLLVLVLVGWEFRRLRRKRAHASARHEQEDSAPAGPARTRR